MLPSNNSSIVTSGQRCAQIIFHETTRQPIAGRATTGNKMLAKVPVLGVSGQTTTSVSRIVDKPKVGQDAPVCGSGGRGTGHKWTYNR